MPRKKKTEKQANLMAQLTSEFNRISEELISKHADDMEMVLEDSEKGALGFSVHGSIDTSESQPKLTVRLKFSEVHTDVRVCQLDDPKQGTFTEIVAGAKKPATRKPAKEAEEEAVDN